MNSATICLGDTVTGLYMGDEPFRGVISALSGGYTMVRLSEDLKRESGAVRYAAGQEIAIAPHMLRAANLKLVSKGTVRTDDVRFDQGHAWV